MQGLVCLPPETLIKIILFLPAKDILSFTKCCITIAEITKLDKIWEKKSQQEFCVKSKNNTNNTKILSESNLHSLQNKYVTVPLCDWLERKKVPALIIKKQFGFPIRTT